MSPFVLFFYTKINQLPAGPQAGLDDGAMGVSVVEAMLSLASIGSNYKPFIITVQEATVNTTF